MHLRFRSDRCRFTAWADAGLDLRRLDLRWLGRQTVAMLALAAALAVEPAYCLEISETLYGETFKLCSPNWRELWLHS